MTSNILIYQTEDGQTKIETVLQDETVWLTQEQMSELFQKARSTINEHIKNIYAENELIEEMSMKKFGNSEFAKKPTNFYNLDVIISVGYRVKSHQGTKFRQWATLRLREYIVKGFTMNDELLKEAGGGNKSKRVCTKMGEINSYLLHRCFINFDFLVIKIIKMPILWLFKEKNCLTVVCFLGVAELIKVKLPVSQLRRQVK